MLCIDATPVAVNAVLSQANCTGHGALWVREDDQHEAEATNCRCSPTFGHSTAAALTAAVLAAEATALLGFPAGRPMDNHSRGDGCRDTVCSPSCMRMHCKIARKHASWIQLQDVRWFILREHVYRRCVCRVKLGSNLTLCHVCSQISIPRVCKKFEELSRSPALCQKLLISPKVVQRHAVPGLYEYLNIMPWLRKRLPAAQYVEFADFAVRQSPYVAMHAVATGGSPAC